MQRLATCFAVLVACHRRDTDGASAQSKVQSALETLEQWNRAHVKHDAAALEALFAKSVDSYGHTLDVHEEAAGAFTTFTFTKTTSENRKSSDHPAVLVVTGDAITGETDSITQANGAAPALQDGRWCIDEPGIANDKVLAPDTISASSAVRRARRTKRFHGLQSGHPSSFLDFGQISWPTKCGQAARARGYALTRAIAFRPP